MARQSHTALETLGTVGGDYSANEADLTMQTADTGNYEKVTFTGAEMIIAHNTHGTTTATVTVESVADDELGRTGDIAYALAAGEYAVFGPFGLNGWRQSSGVLHFKSSLDDVKFGVVEVMEL
jgi:hypothetical protein